MDIQQKFNKENIIYKITRDIDLGGSTLTIPKGCTLDFQGGSFRNGKILLKNTLINNAIGVLQVELLGAIRNKTINTEIFKLDYDEDIIFKSVCTISDYIILDRNLNLTQKIEFNRDKIINGNNFTITTNIETYLFNTKYSVKIYKLKVFSTNGVLNINSQLLLIKNCEFKTTSNNSKNIFAKCDEAYVQYSKFNGGDHNILIEGKTEESFVQINNNIFSGSLKWDNIAIRKFNQGNINNNKSYNSHRSGIVIGEYCKYINVFNNYCFNNKIDQHKEGGWGIVATLNTFKCKIYNNTCLNNKNGGISIDVFTLEGTADSYTEVYSNNCIGGMTGIMSNGGHHTFIHDNYIEDVVWGIQNNKNHNSIVEQNKIFTKNTANNKYFIQVNNVENITITNNYCQGDRHFEIGCFSVIKSSSAIISNNTIILQKYGEEYENAIIFNVHKIDEKKITIINNSIIKESKGQSYILRVSSNTDLIFKNNKCSGNVSAFQWGIYLTGTNIHLYSKGNIIFRVNSNGYFYNNSNISENSVTIDDLYDSIKYNLPKKIGSTSQKPEVTDGSVQGDYYFNTEDNELYIFNGNSWVLPRNKDITILNNEIQELQKQIDELKNPTE